MILQCPSCNARFIVNDALIPPEGRMVRCGRCKHDWHVEQHPVPMDVAFAEPPEAAAASQADTFASFDEALTHATSDEAEALASAAADEVQEQHTQAPTDRRVPALPPPKLPMRQLAMGTAALLLIGLLVLVFARYPQWKYAPVARGLYAGMGYEDTAGLAFADMTMMREVSGNKTRFLVAGNVINRTSEARLLPEVRIRLLDEAGKTLWSRSYLVNKTLSANDIYPFRITNAETSFGDKVAQVEVDLGNAYELAVR